MPIRYNRLHALHLMWFLFFVVMSAAAQANPDRPNPPHPGADYSGMYSFLRDGEFVQLTVEDQEHVTGFVSRFGDAEADTEGHKESDTENARGVFLDHFFKSGKIEGSQLVFTTETVHGLAFEFRGTIERGDGKTRGDEAYYVLKGTLVENNTDAAKKTSSHSSEVSLKSFPQDLAPPPAEKK